MACIAAISTSQIVSISPSLTAAISENPRSVHHLLLPPPPSIRRPRKYYVKSRSVVVVVLAAGGMNNGLEKEEPNGFGNGGDKARGGGGGGGGGDLKRDGRRLRWRDLLDPDPDNILSVGLTGLLTWASVQVLWQLFLISIAILVAALKYSFVAALLLFILITLL